MREAQLRAGDADSTATVGMVENEAVGAVPDGVDGVDSD